MIESVNVKRETAILDPLYLYELYIMAVIIYIYI